MLNFSKNEGLTCNPAQKMKVKKIYGEIEEIEDVVERRYNLFRNFNITPLPPYDHNYLLRRDTPDSRFRPRIKQEWEILHAHTPTSIFIRAYEYRIDLMRVAVIGPPGSDFHHCLFFFDIFFPGSYPLDPPELYYHPYGFDLDINTRSKTWYDYLKQNLHGSNKKEDRSPLLGKKEWDPKESNILHVLDAIQNLILKMKPKSLEGSPDKSGLLEEYSEGDLVLAFEMMIMVLRSPPMGFEVLVEGHFRRRAHPVLLKFKECKDDSEFMINLFMKLFKAFKRNGAYCKHHLDFLKSRNLSIDEVEARIRSLEGLQPWEII